MSSTAPLREALAEALSDRPFTVRLWDGTALPATNGAYQAADIGERAA